METPAIVGQRICTEFDDFIGNHPSNPNFNALRDRLAGWFATLDEQLAFDAMLWVVEHSNRYQHQELAGYLVRQRNVRARLTLDEIIRRVAPCFNASAAEIARYLKDQFGTEACSQVILRSSKGGEADQMIAGLRSLKYWLEIKDLD